MTNTNSRRNRLIAVLLAVATLAGACGSDTADERHDWFDPPDCEIPDFDPPVIEIPIQVDCYTVVQDNGVIVVRCDNDPVTGVSRSGSVTYPEGSGGISYTWHTDADGCKVREYDDGGTKRECDYDPVT